MGLLGAALLVLSPRIFADAFYNSKDLVFMSFFIIGIYTLVQFTKKPSWKRALFHALACAITIDVRIMGVLLPLATIAFFSLDIIKNYKFQHFIKHSLFQLCLYLILLIAIVILLWPFLWEAPVANFVLAFKNMSKFRWSGEVLYMGKLTQATDLPWHYGPVWLLITTPVIYTLFFIAGSFLTVKTLVVNRFKLYTNFAEKQDMLFLAFFYLPLAAVIILHSVLYDGWRHLFFVYPAFLLLALRGFAESYNFLTRVKAKLALTILAALLAVSLLHTVFFMIKAHPYQNVYFSFLPAKTVEKNFERDYWGLSFKEGMEYVMQHDKSDAVYLRVEYAWSMQNSEMLDKEDRERIHWIYSTDPIPANTTAPVYFLTAYRAHPQPYPYKNEVFSRSVNGMKVASVFRER
jgi:hypothetical protein